MPAQIEFNVPLTPVLIASLQEVKRLQQSPNPQDLEALELLLEVINPMLKKVLFRQRKVLPMSGRNLVHNFLVCMAMLIGTLAHATDRPDMQVLLFTDRAHEFTDDGGYPVIYLDEVLRIEEELTQTVSHFNLSENMEPEDVEEIRNELSKVVDEQRLLDAYAGLSLAWSLNITHIPAIVTRLQGERTLVSYGEYNVPDSLVRIRN